MIERYASVGITEIWSDKNKLELWQRTELAVIKAMVELDLVSEEIYFDIEQSLKANPIDLKWWREKEEEINHDLAAFLEERQRFLPVHLQRYFHQNITSYDTEEPAFVWMIEQSIEAVERHCAELEEILGKLARKYRFTIMNGRTHGQEAELQTFGKRCLTWLQVLRLDLYNLRAAKENLKYSKLSGAIGNYGSIDPELEKVALEILGLEPYYGATQIMPREIYAPIAQVLCLIALTLDKIAIDIRLGARSGRPIYQEPFGKKQKGSSAMPHKKNTISTEKIGGMARLAQGFCNMITANITTWEERAIEQSSVERVAWPDLFHTVIHSIKTMNKVLKDLQVYPDNMLLEVIESCGCYASSEAKEFLKRFGEEKGLKTKEAYRIVQLAAFNAFSPSQRMEEMRADIVTSLVEADALLLNFDRAQWVSEPPPPNIREIIAEGWLKFSPQLDISQEEINRWNNILKEIFGNQDVGEQWFQIFSPSYLLKNEEILYKKILGI